ncbi:hypothetical protein P7K49_014841 [Saguinus oedipus]|uniref:Uncharacterized protein n=1 Tax=Saguinus oedipus TaxID=9490 RepID=A0ABQ9V7W5_SAGOE|nr:hypothetical protein P7K49_014841 [Saguinus oedipus]
MAAIGVHLGCTSACVAVYKVRRCGAGLRLHDGHPILWRGVIHRLESGVSPALRCEVARTLRGEGLAGPTSPPAAPPESSLLRDGLRLLATQARGVPGASGRGVPGRDPGRGLADVWASGFSWVGGPREVVAREVRGGSGPGDCKAAVLAALGPKV